MQLNMGMIDRTVRILIALTLVVLMVAEVITGWVAVVAGIAALVFAVTSLVGFCPIYRLLGISSRGHKPSHQG